MTGPVTCTAARVSRVRVAVLWTVTAVVLAACGAPGGEQTAAPSEGQVGEPAASDEAGGGRVEQPSSGDAIRVGVLAPTTGTVASSGQDMLDGWNLYWRQQGERVAGREVQTLHEDTAGDPSIGLNKARRLVGRDVDMIVGPLLANVGLAVAEEMSRENVPLLLPIVSADDLTQRAALPTVIRTAGWTSSQTTHPLGKWAYDQGYRRVVTLCTDYAFGHESCGGFVNTFTDEGGQIVEQLWHPLGTQDFSTFIAQIQAADADAVFVQSVGAESVRFVQAWSEFGMKDEIPFLGGETTLDQSLLRVMGDEALGMISAGHFAEGRNSPATREFVTSYADEYGHLPSYYSAGMYTAARWVAQAVDALDGDVSDRERFLEAVREVQLDDTPMGPMSLDDRDNPIENVYIRRVERDDEGRLVNVPIETFESVSQFWTYGTKAFLEHPVYSRSYQGDGRWPEPDQAGR